MSSDILVRIKGDASDYERATKKAIGLSKDFASAIGVSLSVGGAMLGAKAIIDISDKYSQLDGRLRLVTKSTAEFSAAQTALYKISQDTRVQYESTVDLYTRLARSTGELGISQKDLLTITEGINKALIVSGASGESASAALMQLGQGLASGALRGDELNSVLEQTPRLAQMIADGMGITIGQLRQYGKDGKLSSEAVTKALLSQVNTINSEFSRMPETVGQAMTKLTNVFESIVNQGNNATSSTQTLAGAIDQISATIDKNRDGIINSFIAIANAVSWTADRVAALGNAVALFNAMRAGKVSIGEWATAGPDDAKRLLTRVQAQSMTAKQAAALSLQYTMEATIGRTGTALPKTLPAISPTKSVGGSKSSAKSDAKALESEINSIKRQYDPLGYEVDEYTKRLAALAKYYDDKESLTGERDSLALKMTEEHMQKLDELSGRAKMEKDLKDMQDHFKTQEELEMDDYQAKLDRLAEFRDNEITAEQDYADLKQKIEAEHQENMNRIVQEGLSAREKFNRMSLIQQADTIFGELANITSGVAQHNKTLFQINKAAGIANAVINTYEGVSETLSKYPWPIAGVMAAAHLAAGLAQVSAISSAQFNGGGSGSAPSLSGSTAATPVSNVGQSTALSRTITVYGINKNSLYSGDQIEAIVAGLNDYLADGGVINIA